MREGVIYSITNLVNGKKYIGQSINYKNRIKTHKNYLNTNKHHNNHLQRAWNKYGEDNFEFKVLKDGIPKKDLSDLEMYYINEIYNTYKGKGYNLTLGGEALYGSDNPFSKMCGEKNSDVVLTREEYLLAYIDYKKSNLRQTELGKKHGISNGVVSKLINHKHWVTRKIPKICRLEFNTDLSGAKNPNIALNKTECMEVYKEYRTTEIYQKDLAKKYGVNRRLIESIVNNRHWSTENMPKICIISKGSKFGGYNSGGSKLNKEQCFKIYRRYEEKDGSKKSVADDSPVSYSTVLKILNHNHWSTKDLTKEEILGRKGD